MSSFQFSVLLAVILIMVVWVISLTIMLVCLTKENNRIKKRIDEEYVRKYQLRMTDDNLNILEKRMDKTIHVLSGLISHLGFVYVEKEVKEFVKAVETEEKK